MVVLMWVMSPDMAPQVPVGLEFSWMLAEAPHADIPHAAMICLCEMISQVSFAMESSATHLAIHGRIWKNRS